MAGKKTNTQRSIESYEHRDKQRLNNPPVGLVTPENDRDAGQKKKTYAYDPHLDPQLVWAGKAEHTSFEVPTVSLHVHERIDPRTIIEAVRKKNDQAGPVQLGLFEEERKEPLRQAIEFYQHKHGWTNRLIAGDSLLVMNSLLEKEGMAGKVQMIYIDPPYGIKYGSNFQPFVNKRDVKDGKDEDLTSEPEQIRAFRDTWELGIHSYLTYLRDRLLLARELLTESGSIFVQINDENLHLVRCLLDEVFGRENFVAAIAFRKSGGFPGAQLIAAAHDFLLWYAKERAQVKAYKLFAPKNPEILARYDHLEVDLDQVVKVGKVDVGTYVSFDVGRRLAVDDLSSPGPGANPTPFEYQGREYLPTPGCNWKTTAEGLRRLAHADRLYPKQTRVLYKRYADDFPGSAMDTVWQDTQIGGFAREQEKLYAVQTATKVIERCILMTTDPGDLVFDPTCGSGSTAYVAEKWGRR
jgi:adenine-specific DNA-methyltransferase